MSKIFTLRRTAMFAALSVAASAVFAGAPMVKTQAPGFYRTMVGDFEVTAPPTCRWTSCSTTRLAACSRR